MVARTAFGELACHGVDEFVTPSLLGSGAWEPALTAYLRWRLRPGMTVIDVGAHVGWFTLVASRAVGPAGRVLALEPDPANLALLRHNVTRNDLSNVEVVGAAAGAARGSGRLHRAGRNTGDHRLHPAGEPRPSTPVAIVALDGLASARPPVGLVKIDVQGAEEAVVRGMEGLIAASPGLVVLAEFWPHGIVAAGGDPAGVLAYYRGLGFGVEVLWSGGRFPVALDERLLLARCAPGDPAAQVDLVLTRRPGA